MCTTRSHESCHNSNRHTRERSLRYINQRYRERLLEVAREQGIGPFGYGADPTGFGDYEAFEDEVAICGLAFRCMVGRLSWRRSYGLKHLVERAGDLSGFTGYVCNGSLLVAAHNFAMPVRRIRGGPNGRISVGRIPRHSSGYPEDEIQALAQAMRSESSASVLERVYRDEEAR